AGGPSGGHAATFIECGGWFVFASVHGYAQLPIAEQMALDLASQARCPSQPPAPPARYRTMPAPANVVAACDLAQATQIAAAVIGYLRHSQTPTAPPPEPPRRTCHRDG